MPQPDGSDLGGVLPRKAGFSLLSREHAFVTGVQDAVNPIIRQNEVGQFADVSAAREDTGKY